METKQLITQIKTTPKTNTLAWIKAAAGALAIILTIGIIVIFSAGKRKTPVDWVHVKAIKGKQNINLPDGSIILLRKGSSVSYSSDFGKTRRYIQLKGDAYFEVQENSLMPFSVQATNEINTTEGTSFYIRSNDSTEQVFVSRGTVKLENKSNKGQFIVLKAGEKSELIGNKIVKSAHPNNNHLAWTNEQLVFNKTSLKQVAEDIHNYYGVEVQIQNDINADSIVVTGHFENLPLAEILEKIEGSTDLSIKKDQDTIVIAAPIKAGVPEESAVSSTGKQVKGKKPGTAKKKVSWIKKLLGRDKHM